MNSCNGDFKSDYMNKENLLTKRIKVWKKYFLVLHDQYRTYMQAFRLSLFCDLMISGSNHPASRAYVKSINASALTGRLPRHHPSYAQICDKCLTLLRKIEFTPTSPLRKQKKICFEYNFDIL